MKMQTPTETKLNESESGQAAAVVALFLFFVFLVLASLAIDGSMTYAARRDLQNVADAATLAACIDLTNGGTADSATITATQTISRNLGSWAPFVGSNPGNPPPAGGTTTNQGTGSGLVQGIEVSVPITVASRGSLPTVLT
jgi:Flp pilus assembly protein TadG